MFLKDEMTLHDYASTGMFSHMDVSCNSQNELLQHNNLNT